MAIDTRTTGHQHNGQVRRGFVIFFVISLNTLVSNPSCCRCFETPWCSCDVIVILFVTRLRGRKLLNAYQIDGFMQRDPIFGNALELRLFRIKQSKCRANTAIAQPICDVSEMKINFSWKVELCHTLEMYGKGHNGFRARSCLSAQKQHVALFVAQRKYCCFRTAVTRALELNHWYIDTISNISLWYSTCVIGANRRKQVGKNWTKKSGVFKRRSNIIWYCIQHCSDQNSNP